MCNINSSSGIICLFIYLIITIHVHVIYCASYRIFDTTIIAGSDDTFDCLIHIVQRSVVDPLWFERTPENLYKKTHRYCRRPTVFNSQNILSNENLVINDHKSFSFDHLRSINITYRELYDWYASMDIIEDYITGKSNGSFVNCSNSQWFGSMCEYTFDSTDDLSDILEIRFEAKYNLPTDLSLFTNGTCYEMIDFNCESILCLDWREICDGKIDCKNGFDEQHCQELEMNQCDPLTEHRCFDGQCVDNIESILAIQVECSEQYSSQFSRFKSCYEMHTEECENQKCAHLLFSCGDGYCYDGPSIGHRSCYTQRDQRYLEQMPSSSSLILFSHVHLIYNNTQPKSICYNQTLCPYLSLNNSTMTTTCHDFEIFSNETYTKFDEMVTDVKRLVRSCSLLPSKYNPLYHTCSLYQCEDGSKCISFHRLVDDFNDCTNGDDEHRMDMCSLNLPNPFICDNKTKCISQRLVYDGKVDCNDETDEVTSAAITLNKCINPFSNKCPFHVQHSFFYMIDFGDICNGIVKYISDANNNTDESDCLTKEWPCDAYKFKCDGVWNCPDGHDELGCNLNTLSSIYCNNTQHFCIDINSGKQICLPTKNANDNIIDCVGSSDEREFCRSQYPYDLERRYRCRNSTVCISFRSICDCTKDCPENDDETIACTWFYNIKGPTYKCYRGHSCHVFLFGIFDSRDFFFCQWIDERSNDLWRRNRIEESPSTIIKQNHIKKKRSYETFNHSVIWSCNHGIYVRSRKDPLGFVCFCPDYYYGDRCQYQRKRIKLLLRLQMNSTFKYYSSTFKFVVLLVYMNKTSPIIISHEQFIHRSHFKCLPKIYIPLLYSIKEPYRSFINHSIHIHMFDIDTLEHRYSWNFPLLFEFLPVQIIVKRLFLPEMGTHMESRYISLPYTKCNLCSNNSRHIGYDVSLARDICVCPFNYIGRRCFIPFNPCKNDSCNGHGICQPLSIHRDSDEQFQCICESGWYGFRCKYRSAHVYVSFTRDLKYLLTNMAFLHLVDVFGRYNRLSHYIYFHRLHKETVNITFVIHDRETLLDGGFIQFYEHQNKFDYYFLFLRKLNTKLTNGLSIELQSSHRCRPVNELFHVDILTQPIMQRVKNYQRPCHLRNQDQFLCFYDDDLMCTCTENNYANCFSFQTKFDLCDKIWCNGRGMCVQDHPTCPVYSQCICEPCAYGTFCQTTTAGYTLSLDGIIGSHILLTVTSLSEQPNVIRIAVAIIIIVVLIGIILNVLSICTFTQRETHEVGCGLYLLISSIFGFLSVTILICKTILLLTGKQNNVSCSLIEFLLNWCPKCCQWLNAGVAVERTIAVKRKIQYSRTKSKLFAKWVVLAILIFVGLISMPELFFRGIIIDQLDERAWCVLTLNNERPQILALYSISNILSFLIPLIVNLTSAMIIIYGTSQSKQKTKTSQQLHMNKKIIQRINWKEIKTQIHQHKHILVTPLVLAILSLPQLILTFVFVCTKLDQHSIPSLIAYLVSFIPSMAIPFAFVLPSQNYRTALLSFINNLILKCLENLSIRQN